MENKKELQKYFKNKYYNKNYNYKTIISEIRKEEKINKYNFLKVAITTIITLLSTTSIAFASIKIYNEYLKKQDKIESVNLYLTEDGWYSQEFANDMIYEEDVDLYYKIITNEDEFDTYKTKLDELPDISTIDFDNNFLILIGNAIPRYLHESDLEISKINTDETILYVTLKQKENPNYDRRVVTLYAVVDKSSFREKIKLKLASSNITIETLNNIESLTENYTVEEAIHDGCFVEQNGKILSENKYAIDELIENAQKNIESFLRIYSKSNHQVRIIDLQFKDGIFIVKSRRLENEQIYTHSFKYLTKHYHDEEHTYIYGYNNVDPSFESTLFLIISGDEFMEKK